MLYVDQLNYCGVFRKWHGAGFRAYIHDPYELPQYFFNDLILLSPGYQIDIVIKRITVNRYTEKLGRCTNHVPIWLTPTKSTYIELQCFFECYQFKMYEKCKCVAMQSEEYRKMFAIKYKKNLKQIRLCSLLIFCV